MAPKHRLFVAFILFTLFLMLFGRADSVARERLRDLTTEFFAGMLDTIATPFNAAVDWATNAKNVFLAHEQNEELRAENERLLMWKEAALKLESQVARYNALLKVQLDPEVRYVTGRSISDSANPYSMTRIINVGKRHGVEKRQAVVDSFGLIGHIVGIGERASRVLLITDVNSRIPVKIEPLGIQAVLAGDNNATPYLKFLKKDDRIKTKARVVTSGAAGFIPPGIPIGTVAGWSGNSYEVKLAGEVDHVGYVRVVKFSFPKTFEPIEEELEVPEQLPETDLPGPIASQTAPPSAQQVGPSQQMGPTQPETAAPEQAEPEETAPATAAQTASQTP